MFSVVPLVRLFSGPLVLFSGSGFMGPLPVWLLVAGKSPDSGFELSLGFMGPLPAWLLVARKSPASGFQLLLDVWAFVLLLAARKHSE